MAAQKCDGSGIIYSYNRITQQMQEGICPSCLGTGCSGNSEAVKEAAHMAWVKLIPVAALLAMLIAMCKASQYAQPTLLD